MANQDAEQTREGKEHAMTRLLAPLKVGDRLPWRLDANGEGHWLTVIEVVDSVTYIVRYPDGAIGALVDSE
jgi:hypothetical protein